MLTSVDAENYLQDLERAEFVHRQEDGQVECPALQILHGIKPSQSWITATLAAPLYRVVERSADPLESKFTFAAGGRVNIGMAQVIAQLPSLKATGGVYASSDKTTAIVEYTSSGLPLTAMSTGYELTPPQGHQNRFVDFDIAVTLLAARMPFVNLIAVVAETPFAACWKYQKIPKLSQIIGNWIIAGLQQAGTEISGLIFRSTKNPAGINTFIVNPSNWTSTKIKMP